MYKKIIFLCLALLSVWGTAHAEETQLAEKMAKPLVNPKKPKPVLPVKQVLPAKAVSPATSVGEAKPAQRAKPSIAAKAALKADVAKPAASSAQ